jgi:hypothetical protein
MHIRIASSFIAAFIAVILPKSALAVIAAKTPPSSMYAQSRAVILGKITKVSADTGVIEASATALSGESPADVVKIKLDGFPEALKSAKEGQPLVLFLGKKAANSALHLGDAWYWPEAAAKGNFVVRKDRSPATTSPSGTGQADLRQSYPGTTTALAALVQELKANGGKYSMLDKVSPDIFKGGTKDLGNAASLKLPKFAGSVVMGNFGEVPKHVFGMVVKDDGVFRHAINSEGAPVATADGDFTRLTGEPVGPYQKRFAGATAAALDCNGDGRMDVLINSPQGPLLLINRGFGCFFVNGDIGKTLGNALPPNAKWTAQDIDGDKHDDLVVVSEDGKATAILNAASK